jgi:hypothetical protein
MASLKDRTVLDCFDLTIRIYLIKKIIIKFALILHIIRMQTLKGKNYTSFKKINPDFIITFIDKWMDLLDLQKS